MKESPLASNMLGEKRTESFAPWPLHVLVPTAGPHQIKLAKLSLLSPSCNSPGKHSTLSPSQTTPSDPPYLWLFKIKAHADGVLADFHDFRCYNLDRMGLLFSIHMKTATSGALFNQLSQLHMVKSL